MGGYRTKVTAATPQLLPTGQIGAFVAAALERGDSVQYVPAQIALPFTDIVTVTTLALPVGLEGFAYTAALAALGGTLPYTWGATGLPAWAMLSGNTISGTPNSTAPSTLTVTATDADGRVSLPVVLSLMVSGVGIGAFAYASGSDPCAYAAAAPQIVASASVPSATGSGPQQLFTGAVQSDYVVIACWPTVAGGESGYNVYRAPGLNASFSSSSHVGVATVTISQGGGCLAAPEFIDTAANGLTPGTAYTYWMTATFPGSIPESLPSNSVNQTTLAGPVGTAPTLPTPPIEPATWVVAPPAPGSLKLVPAGNTLWQASTIGSGAGTPGANAGGGTTVAGCGLTYALANLNSAGGDVIALTAGQIYPTTGFVKLVTKARGFTYITSTQAPEYAGSGGTLPAYVTPPATYNPVYDAEYTTFTLTAAIPQGAYFTGAIVSGALTVSAIDPWQGVSGALTIGQYVGSAGIQSGQYVESGTTITAGTAPNWTVSPSQSVASRPMISGTVSATLTTPWTGRTGVFPTRFTPATAGQPIETRLVTYTNGSAAISWSPLVPLIIAATTAIQVHVGQYVTAADLPSMAQIQFTGAEGGNGLSLAALTQGIRFIGIAISAVSGGAVAGLQTCVLEANPVLGLGVTPNPCDHVYWDRCYFGTSTDNYLNPANLMSFVLHGITLNGNHHLINQCCFQGLVSGGDGSGLPGSDANGIYNTGGGPQSLVNCYIEAQAEGSIAGGGGIGQNNLPNNLGTRYNYWHKPSQWMLNGIGSGTKNHHEYKVGQYVHSAGNLYQYNWTGYASQGQHARTCPATARDQLAGWGPANGTGGLTAVTSVSGTTITFTTNNTTANEAAQPGRLMWVTGVPGVTPILVQMVSASNPTPGTPAGSTWTGIMVQSIGTSTGAGGSMTPSWAGACPWNRITDVLYQNERSYECGSFGYPAMGDSSPTAFTARIQYKNILFIGDQGICNVNGAGGGDSAQYANPFTGGIADITYDHLSALINVNCPNTISPSLYDSAFYYEGNEFGMLADRVTVTNCLLDGAFAFNDGGNTHHGVAAINNMMTNSTVTNNLPLLDATTLNGAGTNGNLISGNFPQTPYASVGFADWPGTVVPPPVPAGDLTITSGTYATASTTGGPLGATFAVPTAGLAAAPYPRIGVYAIGGNLSGFTSGNCASGMTFAATMAFYNFLITTGYEGDGLNWPSLMQTWKANAAAKNTLNNGAKLWITRYNMLTELFESTSDDPGMWQYPINCANNSNWWLRDDWPSGAIVSADKSQNGWVNVTPANTVACASFSQNGVANPYAGQSIWTCFANFTVDANMNGTNVSKYGESIAVAANPYLDGIMLDNQFCIPRSAGSWDMGNDNTSPNRTNALSIQAGWGGLVAAFRAYDSDIIMVGNADLYNNAGNSNVVPISPSWAGAYDGAIMEGFFGYSGGEASGFATGLANIAVQEQLLTPNGVTLIGSYGEPNNGAAFPSTQSSWTSGTGGQWQLARYEFGMTQLRNSYFTPNMTNDTNPTAAVLFDELYQTAPGASGLSTGWLSYGTGPSDPPQVSGSPWSQGVYLRRFSGGAILVNPRGNGAKTFTVGSGTGQIPASMSRCASHTISGTQAYGDTAVNTGAAVSGSVTLQDTDALFLVGVW